MLKLVVFSLVLFSSILNADSLWSPNQGTLYRTSHLPNVGDVVTVYVSNQTSAIQEAGTDTSKRSELGADIYDLWDQYSVDGSSAMKSDRQMKNSQIRGNDAYRGLGKTTRKSAVKAVISAVVTEIFPNGNLFVVGKHSINVNDETEIIQISGIVRPQDISQNNSVFSYQLAHAEISVKGEGVVGSKQTPGVLTKMFNWVF